MSGFGVYTGYDTGTYAVEGYFGRNKWLGVSSQNIGILGSYHPSDRLFVSAHYDRQNFVDEKDSSFGIGAEYDVGGGWSLYAGATSTRISNTAYALTMTQSTIGIGYEPSALPGKISVDWIRTKGFSVNRISTFTLGWTIPIGQSPKHSQNCVMRGTRGQYRGPEFTYYNCQPMALIVN